MRFQNGLNHLAGFIRCPQGGHILVYIGGAYKRGSSFCLSRVGGPKRWFCHVFFSYKCNDRKIEGGQGQWKRERKK